MHNQTDSDITIPVGDKIASLMFYELATKYEYTTNDSEYLVAQKTFVENCSSGDMNMRNDLKALLDRYEEDNGNGANIRKAVKRDNYEEFKRVTSGNDLKATIKRNIPLVIFGSFLLAGGIVWLLMQFGKISSPAFVKTFVGLFDYAVLSVFVSLLTKKID